MKNVVSELNSRAGEYEGPGINHEGPPFKGRLSLRPIVENKGVSLAFTTIGLDGVVYHHEQSLISMDMAEKLCLWNLNTSIAGLLEHSYRREESLNEGLSHVFGFGDPEDKNSLREEVGIDMNKAIEFYESVIRFKLKFRSDNWTELDAGNVF